jgi:hypothetical protein
MRKRFLARLSIILLSLASLPAISARAAPRCFPEVASVIVDCVDGQIAAYWAEQGGLPVFGYPIGPQHQEPSSAGDLSVQLFERARLELHPENAPPYDVLLGRLGADSLAMQGRDWTAFPKGDASAPHYFSQTGHAIAPQFWSYWSSHGLEFDGQRGKSFNESLALFGMPLSEAQTEINPTDGKAYLTQWFERARFEYHQEFAGTPDEVQLGLLQRELQASSAAPAGPPVPAAPAPGLQSSGFIQASGGQLVLQGQPIQIKGVNYYPQWRPWDAMWTGWDGPQVERELRQARDQLGINVVRVMLPYNFTDTRDGEGKVTPKLIARLREMAQIAGSLDMRLIVTLFDFYESFPDRGTNTEAENLAYLRALIPSFADDDRILAWDVHNEPDNYLLWTNGGAQKVLAWLGRMADAIHTLAPHQLVTVGMGQASSLWLPGPDGRRVIDYSDLVSMHTYDAGAVARDLDQLRAQTTKPIVIEEFGWPTGPACMVNYSETTQVRLYQAVLSAAKDRTAGVVAWTLRDYDAGPTDRWDTREEHFGLYRPDGSLKPAADLIRAIAAPRLPSATTTNQPLTSINPRLPSGSGAPLLVPESGHYVKGLFRKAWELMGGRASFGLPLTEAFVRQSDRVVAQYFEGALLEYHPKEAGDLSGLATAEQVVRAIWPAGLGRMVAGGRSLPAPQPPQGAFLDFYNGINGAWRLGNPISAEFTEDINGAPTRVQYFEKGRLEWNPSTQSVAVGSLGKSVLDAQCEAAK